MHSASLKFSLTRRAPTAGSGEAKPLGELRSASSSAMTLNLVALPGGSTTRKRPCSQVDNNRHRQHWTPDARAYARTNPATATDHAHRSEEHTSELQSLVHLVCR